MENINLTLVKGDLSKSRNRFVNFVNPGSIPEDLAYVPGFVEDLVNWTLYQSHSPNRTLAFAGALAMLAHLSGRTFSDASGTRTNLYVIALAPSGSGKESPRSMNNLLANYAHAMVTLGFNNKTGLVIFADGATAVPDGTVLTKAQWNALQNAGCVFFVADNYRAATGTIENRIPAAGAGSYFWLNNGNANSNTASALYVDKVNGATVVNNVPKNVGAFVRLVKEL